MSFPHLFSPIRLGDLEVKNRTAMAPINNGLLSTDETWPLRTIRYYEERAKGGIGLIITGACRVHGILCGFPKVGIYDERFIPSHRRLVEAAHRHGAAIFCQLQLNGGKVGKEAPTAMYNPAYPCMPPELTTDQADELVESFIRAAGFAREAGYDGVEVHGGHTYLIGQFVSPSTNKRTDKYGGSFENRMRFPKDILTGIHERYPGFPAGIKFSAFEELADGIDIPLGVEIGKYLARFKPAYLHVSASTTEMLAPSRWGSVPCLYNPRNSLVPLAAGIKKACPDSVVMGTGSITVPEEAEEIIASGVCDMVAIGRTVLADPEWPEKAREGRTKSITPCIRCMVCYNRLWQNEPLECSMNPYLSREAEQELTPAVRKKKVMVVGGGPTGVRCALTASKRGHRVILCEKMPYIGGMMYPGSRPSFKEDVARALAWMEDELARSAVEVRLNTEATPELVEAEDPDALVIAVGAEQIVPKVPGMDKPHVAFAVDVLRDISRYPGKRAVVIGGGDVGCETACYLADNGFGVTIVEQYQLLMTHNNRFVRIEMIEMLKEKKVTVLTETLLSAVVDIGAEVLLPSGKRWGIEADRVIIAAGFEEIKTIGEEGPALMARPKPGLIAALSMKAPEVHIIGDCFALGRIVDAMREGERVGRWL
jgi:2,4-dienoyl-CoA reductase-like NADH-dependent reductase (Old Yellow Enzyme family)/thioredoxin reductase